MFEPLTLSVPELAERWKQTPRQIIESAAALRLSLLFNFDGLVFDDRRIALEEWQLTKDRESAIELIASGEDTLKRRAAGLLSEWDDCRTSDDAVALRESLDSEKQTLKGINDKIDMLCTERQNHHFRGYLRAGPATIDDLSRLGYAKHPIRAYRPEGPFSLLPDGFLEGPIVNLESGQSPWKERLEVADMLISMAEVKAIEAADTAKTAATSGAPEKAAPHAPMKSRNLLPAGVPAAEIIEKFKLGDAWAEKLRHIDRYPFLKVSGALMQQGCRKSATSKGMPNLFNPVKFAEMLIAREGKMAQQMKRVIESRFSLWQDEWDAAQAIDAPDEWDE